MKLNHNCRHRHRLRRLLKRQQQQPHNQEQRVVLVVAYKIRMVQCYGPLHRRSLRIYYHIFHGTNCLVVGGGGAHSTHPRGNNSRHRRRHNCQIVELGCGTGLISLSLYQQAIHFLQVQPDDVDEQLSQFDISIIATDLEMIPLQVVQYAANTYIRGNKSTTNAIPTLSKTTSVTATTPAVFTHRNNNHQVTLQTQLFDVCNMSQPLPIKTLDDETHNSIIVIVVGDLLYETTTALALAQRIIHAKTTHSSNTYNTNSSIHIIVGDSPGRIGRPIFLDELNRHYLNATSATNSSHNNSTAAVIHQGNNNVSFLTTTMIMGQTITTPRNTLICGPTSTTIGHTINDTTGECFPRPIEIDILHI